MTYSVDFGKRALEIKKEEGLTCEEVAKRFKIEIMTVVRWGKRLEPVRKRNKPSVKINVEALKDDIRSYPDAYQYERAERLGASPSGIRHALRRLGATYKKNSGPSQGRPGKAFCILPGVGQVTKGRQINHLRR